MKKILLTTIIFCCTAAFAETWTNVPLIDGTCARKVRNNPDAHTRACALQCAGSGYGIQTSDGRYLKFDKKGNEQALKLLRSSSKIDHLRVNVNGTQHEDTIAVQSVSF